MKRKKILLNFSELKERKEKKVKAKRKLLFIIYACSRIIMK